ncbi:hypothetical protein N7465_001620 [Penicillium sp. CMV-2018d]|nr:hypothetical protein N7465_001620 [Penicillium sp. CMV-2018d]
MTTVLRMPTLVLAIICLALIGQSQATVCAAVCEKQPRSCPYGQKVSGFEVCLPPNRSFTPYTNLTRFVYTGLLGLLSVLLVPIHNESNDLSQSHEQNEPLT